MKKLFLLFNTIRYLKWQQIYHRIIQKLIIPKATESFQGPKPNRCNAWENLTLYDEKIDNKLQANFLNYTKKLEFPADWNNELLEKLWVYNLHYFDDFLSKNAKEKRNLHLHLFNLWIDQNPIGYGNGWESYPTSLRIVNILKAWLGGLELDEKHFASVYTQASFLSSNLEKHLLGNHYFANLKALFFAGIIFKNTDWLNIAKKGLLSEIPEQILQDGANFELSPMYHSIMLVDMLDILNLIKAYSVMELNDLVLVLNDYIPRMLRYMEIMSHPDGGLSFFNDSSDGIAPSKSKIENYAQKLGFKIEHLDTNKLQIIDNVNSGYICATAAGNKLIFDASPIGPDYIPGHAHADTLSFELSIAAQRVFVNSGISEYGLSLKRLQQRKTASHNTVEVDGKDSSQVWSSFRVANRARIISRQNIIKNDQSIELTASHNGYNSLFLRCIHTRKLIFNENKLIVIDSLQDKFSYAKSRFFFHPNLNISLEDDLLRIDGPEFTLFSNLKNKAASLEDTFWYPEFGKELPNKMLLLDFNNKDYLKTEFVWSKN